MVRGVACVGGLHPPYEASICGLRSLIRARTSEGRRRAKAHGVKMSRPPKLAPHKVKEALLRRNAGELVWEIARSYNVSHSTISRLSSQDQAGA